MACGHDVYLVGVFWWLAVAWVSLVQEQKVFVMAVVFLLFVLFKAYLNRGAAPLATAPVPNHTPAPRATCLHGVGPRGQDSPPRRPWHEAALDLTHAATGVQARLHGVTIVGHSKRSEGGSVTNRRSGQRRRKSASQGRRQHSTMK